ncbi:hypothetical protein Ciccas_010242 [Cichlidogyrus casuarinus]|uniref:Ig-like domain-containing protein n=1 Tax=Cichlidogyrus casuarinus TaxID=1844966 RepID=A0ABD2PUQ9_9PLAT
MISTNKQRRADPEEKYGKVSSSIELGITRTDNGSYLLCLAQNDVGQSENRTANLIVYYMPIITIGAGREDLVRVVGERFSLPCQADSNPAANIIWMNSSRTLVSSTERLEFDEEDPNDKDSLQDLFLRLKRQPQEMANLNSKASASQIFTCVASSSSPKFPHSETVMKNISIIRHCKLHLIYVAPGWDKANDIGSGRENNHCQQLC